MDNKIIYQNHINMISIQLLYCMGGYVTYEVVKFPTKREKTLKYAL